MARKVDDLLLPRVDISGAQVSPNLPFLLAGGTTLYGALVTRGTPTYLAGSLHISLHIEQDN